MTYVLTQPESRKSHILLYSEMYLPLSFGLCLKIKHVVQTGEATVDLLFVSSPALTPATSPCAFILSS